MSPCVYLGEVGEKALLTIISRLKEKKMSKSIPCIPPIFNLKKFDCPLSQEVLVWKEVGDNVTIYSLLVR